MYWTTAECAETFDKTSELEKHMFSGKHSIPEEISSLDQMKTSFTERMKLTSQQDNPTSPSTSTNPDETVSQVCKNFFSIRVEIFQLERSSSFPLSKTSHSITTSC